MKPIRSTLQPDNGARFSMCRVYRYALWRFWDRSLPFGMFIGLNPSTADETNNDPTVRRCIRFVRDWGFGGLIMTNAFAIRATDPRVMLAHEDPIGPNNDYWLKRIADEAGIVIAAWGIHGSHRDRDKAILSMLDGKVRHLGLTKAGNPRHPLYLRADTKPTRY